MNIFIDIDIVAMPLDMIIDTIDDSHFFAIDAIVLLAIDITPDNIAATLRLQSLFAFAIAGHGHHNIFQYCIAAE